MKPEVVKVLVLRAEGTNCDGETAHAVEELGSRADVVHLNRLIKRRVSLEDYQAAILPGGFSFGDRVRSGAILGKVLSHSLARELNDFVEEGKPVLGVCNGFQALLEAGLLPGKEDTLALGENLSARFEDRWCFLRREGRNSLFTRSIGQVSQAPVANSEGRLVLPEGKEKEILSKLEDNNQICFRYAHSSGEAAGGSYPENPSGSAGDIAGITSEEGNVLGMMPHPERAYYRYMYPDWTREDSHSAQGFGEGYIIFKDMLDYIVRRF